MGLIETLNTIKDKLTENRTELETFCEEKGITVDENTLSALIEQARSNATMGGGENCTVTFTGYTVYVWRSYYDDNGNLTSDTFNVLADDGTYYITVAKGSILVAKYENSYNEFSLSGGVELEYKATNNTIVAYKINDDCTIYTPRGSIGGGEK